MRGRYPAAIAYSQFFDFRSRADQLPHNTGHNRETLVMSSMLTSLRATAAASKCFRPVFRRAATVGNARYIQQQAADPVEKYRAKLEKKAKEVGAKDINELKEKLKDTIEEHKKEFSTVDPLKELEEYQRKQAIEAQEKAKKAGKLRDPRAPDVPEKPYKTLDSFLDVSKIGELPQREIEYIWKARFQDKENALISVIPSEVFDKLYQNARENPIFVLPLPRDPDGFELHYIQWSFVGPNTVHCMFTTLLEFKTHKEFARPHTSLIFHTELKDSKNLVLMNGTVEADSSVKLSDAQLLLLNIQRFYGAMVDTEVAKRRLQLLRDFTSGSPNFSVDKLVAEAQSLEN